VSRLEQLREMLKARTDAKGRALPGYGTNVEMIRTEIERLEKDEQNGG
jgi:ribosomal protein S2